jgi:hypothetical protein
MKKRYLEPRKKPKPSEKKAKSKYIIHLCMPKDTDEIRLRLHAAQRERPHRKPPKKRTFVPGGRLNKVWLARMEKRLREAA